MALLSLLAIYVRLYGAEKQRIKHTISPVFQLRVADKTPNKIPTFIETC